MVWATQFYKRGYLCKKGREPLGLQSYNYYKMENQCIPTALHGEQSLLSEWGEIWKKFPRPISVLACSFFKISKGSWTKQIQTPQDPRTTCASGLTLRIIYSPTHAEGQKFQPSTTTQWCNVQLKWCWLILINEKCSPVLLKLWFSDMKYVLWTWSSMSWMLKNSE